MSDTDLLDIADMIIDNQQPQITERPWMKECEFILVTADNIDAMVDECIASGRFSYDLECTGLDNRVFLNERGFGETRDKLVGACLSPDGIKGYYAPVGHTSVELDGTRTPRKSNIPWPIFAGALRRLGDAVAAGKTVAIFHNGKFDQEYLEYPGEEPFGDWSNPKHWDDTMLMAYLADARAKRRGLKMLSKTKLDMEMIELKELYPSEHKGGMDFSLLDPSRKDTLWYGGGDGICTYRLYEYLAPAIYEPDTDGRDLKNIYLIEKGASTATRWMERCRIHLDLDKVMELITLGQQEWYDSVNDVYDEAAKILGRDAMPGFFRVIRDNFSPADSENLLPQQLRHAKTLAKQQHPDPQSPIIKGKGPKKKEYPPVYDISSAQQLGKMFEEMGVPGLTYTEKSKQVKTDKATLNKIFEVAEDDFPFLMRIKRFRETAKALTNYLFPMLLSCEPDDHTIRIGFKQDGTDTGRYATPKGKIIIPGHPQMNLHSIPSTYDPSRPECMSRLRECISGRKGKNGKQRVIVAIDYSGEELRLITNLSGEPKWRNEFFHCANCDRNFDKGDGSKTPEAPPCRCPNCGSDKIGDLHTLTGISLFGSDAPNRKDWKKVRGQAKATNFALSYGGGGNAVCNSTGVDKNEGWRIKHQFDNTYPTLRAFWKKQHGFAEQHGFVRTAFFRKYPVPDIWESDRGFKSKAQRNSVNGPVQGAGADMIKIAKWFVHREIKARGWEEDVLLIATMHDELVFEMDRTVVAEAIEVIVPIMCSNIFILRQCWPVPFTSDVELGFHWMVPWDLNTMRAKRKYDEVRFIGDTKYYKAKDLPKGYDWNDLPTWPESLIPYFPEASGQPPTTPSETPPSGTAPKESQPPTPPPTGEEGSASTSPQEEDTASPEEAKEPAPARSKADTPHVHRLRGPLTVDLAFRLAYVIHHCKGSGSKPLVIKAPDGSVLDKWSPSDDPVRVSAQEFHIVALEHRV